MNGRETRSASGPPAMAGAAQWAHPAIAEFGRVRPMPEAGMQPDPDLLYRVMFDITGPAGAKSEVNPGLDHVARFVNLLAASGVPPHKAEIVAMVHGPATGIVLTNAACRAGTGADNPNLPLIRSLRDNGVAIHVCGQALAERGFAPEAVDPQVEIDLAALTTLATCQLRGFALIPG